MQYAWPLRLIPAFTRPKVSNGYTMSKERKTASELEDMIRAELDDPSVSVSVRPSMEVGWVTVTSTWFGALLSPLAGWIKSRHGCALSMISRKTDHSAALGARI
jgi:hypothetical protein